jgi:hypothetical protein
MVLQKGLCDRDSAKQHVVEKSLVGILTWITKVI